MKGLPPPALRESPQPPPPVRLHHPLIRRRGTASRPRSWHIRVGAGATQLFVRHKSFDIVKDNDLVDMADVSIGGEWNPFGGLSVMVHVGWVGDEFRETLFQDYTTETFVDTILVGMTAGYRFWDALLPYARFGYAGTWTKVNIHDGGVEPGGKRKFSSGFFATGGIELSVPRRWILRGFRTWGFTLGVRFEAGYMYLGKFGWGGGRDTSRLVDHYPSALGDLEIHGAIIRVGTFLSF